MVEAKGFFAKLSGGTDSIDLDASCLAFDGAGNLVETVWFQKLVSSDGSIRHSGDNLTGEGDGDDETISIDLTRLPSNVETLVLRSEEHTSELQSLMRISYAVFCLKKKNNDYKQYKTN